MEFLSFLESLRTPWLDAVMSAVTLLGSEGVFLTLALYVFWCTEKRNGYYLLTVGFLGITVNQFLKIACRVPRPWIRNPALTVVGDAKVAATGYSFPSGHTQNITGTLGVVATTQKRRWLRALCIATVLLVAFSRMYLGVHTPADVGVSLLAGTVLVLALRPLMARIDGHPRRLYLLLLGMLALALAYLIYVLCWPFPADIDPVNLAEAEKNAWTLVGAVSAMGLCGWADCRWLRFPTHAVWWAQLVKTAAGLGLVLAVKEGLKPILSALCGGAVYTNAIRYFFVVVVAALLWPLSFRAFARLGNRQK